MIEWWLRFIEKIDPIDCELRRRTNEVLMLPIMVVTVFLTPLFILELIIKKGVRK